jgi:hypothetical protein
MDKGNPIDPQNDAPPTDAPANNRVRGFLAGLVTRWFHASEEDIDPKVREARASFADAAQRWFGRQADWLKGMVISVSSAVTILTNREKYERLKKYKAAPEDRPCSLLNQTVDTLAERFGAPRVEEVKAVGWHVNARLDIIVQKDQNWGTYIWMTWPMEDVRLGRLCEVYVAGRGRHNGTYLLPTLCRGNAALKIKVAHPAHLRTAMEMVEAAAKATGDVRQTA